MTKIEELKDQFKLPIYFNDKKVSIKNNIVTDLELIQTIDTSNNENCIYNFVFNQTSKEKNEFSHHVMTQVCDYYTTDTEFLQETQLILKSYQCLNLNLNIDLDKEREKLDKKYNEIMEVWKDIKTDNNFKEKYYFMDWPQLEFLNKSEYFLQSMSMFNLLSPIISLFLPIIILIIPFFIIKLKGIHLSINEYVETLKIIISNHTLGKLFTQFHEVKIEQKIYLLFSAAFYVFSIYQNICICLKFNNNMKKIHQSFDTTLVYIENTILKMDNYLSYSSSYTSYALFNDSIIQNKNILIEFSNKIKSLSKYKLSCSKVMEIGIVLKYFYELYENKVYNNAFLYSFGFNGYIDCIEGLLQNIGNRQMNYVDYTKDKNKNKITNNYYAPLKNMDHVKNNIKLKKNLIITGPNASGKTTILKSTLINIIISQQFGCGFYDSATLKPYKFIHCYLNIPDTSGRDSLFQAEARRCKEILDMIELHPNETHFCMFDELYSGTNPDEAISSSIAFMNYLVKNKNITSLLTTHFVKACKKLKKNKLMENYHMNTSKINGRIVYSYLLKEGISDVKGGINILSDMNYPKEILNTITYH
jgi:hypothetical protein